ncbi:MAG: tetratricopeptide repeat protein [Nitrospirae bacterium]|nr:tetratricopeptide repeat protein [Nitrospirota bacterium]
MNRADRWTRMGTAIARRAALWWLLTGLIFGCASVPRPEGSATKGQAVAGSPTKTTGSTAMDGGLQAGYRQALSYLDQGQLENAQSALEPLVASHPDRIDLHNTLGILYRRRGMLDKAIDEYQKAIALSERAPEASPARPVFPELYNNLAIAYREQGDFQKAEKIYRKAMALNPKFAPVYYNLGVLYDLYLNQPKEAVRYYQNYEALAGKNQTVDIWIADLEQRTAHGAANVVGQP